MADLIATEAYAQSIGGASISYTSNLCCTKSRAIALGCDVAGTYADNQLVRKEDLSIATYSLKNITSDYLSNVRIWAGSCIFTGNLPPDGVLYTTSAPSSSSWSISINGSISNIYKVYPAASPDTYSYAINVAIPDTTVTMNTYTTPDYYYEVSISINGVNENNETLYFNDLYYPKLEIGVENNGVYNAITSVDLSGINNNSYFGTFGTGTPNMGYTGTLRARFTCRVSNNPASQIYKEAIEYWT